MLRVIVNPLKTVGQIKTWKGLDGLRHYCVEVGNKLCGLQQFWKRRTKMDCKAGRMTRNTIKCPILNYTNIVA